MLGTGQEVELGPADVWGVMDGTEENGVYLVCVLDRRQKKIPVRYGQILLGVNDGTGKGKEWVRSFLGVRDETGEGKAWVRSFWVLTMGQEKGRRRSNPPRF